MREISIVFPLVGASTGKAQVRVETSGFVGAACQSATEALQKALGQTTHTELKAEYFVSNDPQVETVNE